MNGNPHGYNIRAIRKLLKRAFDATRLNSLCFDYYYHVFQQFGPEMQTDARIDLLLGDCLKLPTGLDRLLEIVRGEAPEIFKLFEQEIYASENSTAKKTATVTTVNQFDKLRDWLDYLVDAEFRDMMRALLSPREQTRLSKPLELIDRGSFLGQMQIYRRFDKVELYLCQNYPERFPR